MALINPPLHFADAMVYKLKEADRYDDEFGAGYGYALVADEGCSAQCWVADCWIVNEKLARHPGIDASPVPVRFEDVDAESVRALTNEERAKFGLSFTPASKTKQISADCDALLAPDSPELA